MTLWKWIQFSLLIGEIIEKMRTNKEYLNLKICIVFYNASIKVAKIINNMMNEWFLEVIKLYGSIV